MRAWLVCSAALWAAGIVAQQVADTPPPWLVLVGLLFGSGFVGRYLLARLERKWEKRLQDATAAAQEATAEETQLNTRRAMEELQTSILNRARAEHAEMQAELEQVKTQLAQANTRAAQAETNAAQKDAEIARLTNKVHVLASRIEALHDQLAAAERGEEFGRRRLDDDK